MTKEDFLKEFDKKGHVLIKNILNTDFVQCCLDEIQIALTEEVKYIGTQEYKFYGYVLSNAKYGGSFLELLDNPKVTNPMNWVLGDHSILYSYTSSSMPPQQGNDSSHIHVDCPVFLKDYILRMGVLIPLVDFTLDNGATYYLEGSHKSETEPSEELFYTHAKRLTIKAGDGWFFNTRMWHSGGINHTNTWRHAITLNICRPWMKQYLDLPKLLQTHDLSNYSENVLQKLGFYSQPPTSYDEYYDTSRKRLFS
jgi:ectoine hydroxylase-related dioxygenase (phytanoyl-CoA dioxygenase family)